MLTCARLACGGICPLTGTPAEIYDTKIMVEGWLQELPAVNATNVEKGDANVKFTPVFRSEVTTCVESYGEVVDGAGQCDVKSLYDASLHPASCVVFVAVCGGGGASCHLREVPVLHPGAFCRRIFFLATYD